MYTRLALAVLCLAAAPARADIAPAPAAKPAVPSGPEVLARLDKAINAFKDAVWESKLRIKESSGQWRELLFTTYQKSPGKRLVRFTGGENKGMNVLIESADVVYVYLPEFKKVRRMGTHVNNQNFGGSDFSSEDMSQTSYSNAFDAKLAGEDASNYILELTLKSGQQREFPRLKMWVHKEHSQATRIEYMDASGKKLKTEERFDYKKDSPEHWQPGRITVTDHRKGDHQSEIVFLSSKIDSGLSDDMFSVRALQR